jgi:hypothetical protein
MNSVTVNVANVLKVLKINKKEHIKKYKEAVEGYWTEMALIIEKIKAKLDAKAKLENMNINLHIPVSYEDEYETAIQMLLMHCASTIDMSKEDFERMVLDKWEWKQNWSISNSKYWDNKSK